MPRSPKLNSGIIRLFSVFSVLLFSGAGVVYAKTSGILLPGPLSSVSNDGDISGGYETHAEFEGECGHCHAPIHCLSEDKCQSCHQDVAMQRQLVDGIHGRLPAARCQTCHTEHQGREAIITIFAYENVDHGSISQFSLNRHQNNYDGSRFDCYSCHSHDQYSDASLDCITCHEEGDLDFIQDHRRIFGDGCIDCHDGADRMMPFNHDLSYALEGEHADVECEACHAGEGKLKQQRNCIACHEEPEMHAGIFGQECVRCHTDMGWSPAMLTQHTFRLDHGNDGQRPCQDCHDENYTGYSCIECHDHPLEAMFEVHAEYEINELDQCADCHPTGAPGEAQLQAQANDGSGSNHRENMNNLMKGGRDSTNGGGNNNGGDNSGGSNSGGDNSGGSNSGGH